MAGCDGWITIKIFELLFACFCMIYKRVTDDEANKLFYFLQKFSREWPLLNNVTWEENGAIFTDITYGGYIIIIIGLIIGQCSGELQKCRKLENFFLIVGALLFIAAGSLELASLESVEERLVDNAAILGVFSLLTGFLFIIDLLSASRRRKKTNIKLIQKNTQCKLTQTEEKQKKGDMNGNINYNGYSFQNGGSYVGADLQRNHRIPKNAVKILPSSTNLHDHPSVTNDYNGTILFPAELPVIDKSELQTHAGRIKSTESFLRSEKGLYPKIRKISESDKSNNHFFVPAGYVLVPADNIQEAKSKSDSGVGESPTPSGYAKIIPETKVKQIKNAPGYVIIPIDQSELNKKVIRKEKSSQSPNSNRHTLNYSDMSDLEESNPDLSKRHKYERRSNKFYKFRPEYLEMDPKGRKYGAHSEDSSDEHNLDFGRDSRYSVRSQGPKDRHYHSKGRVNEGYSYEKNGDIPPPFQRNAIFRSSRDSSPEKLKSILRFQYDKSQKSKDDLYFPKDVRYDSLDSQKIAEDLKNLKEITKSDLDLTRDTEKENKVLKERLRLEKEERERLRQDLENRQRLDAEEEKNRRISEREEQYFGIKDLKQIRKESMFEEPQKTKQLKDYLKKDFEKVGKGAKEINEKLKEKHLEHENKAAKEAQEYRDLIDERFYFLDEEEKKKPRKALPPGKESDKISDVMDRSKAENAAGKLTKSQKSESDETNYSQSTEEEIRLRVETPGSASYKSEALFWLGNEREEPKSSPMSPGYVLYTAKNWPESPSPDDRFQFSAKEAQHLAIGTPPKTPVSEPAEPDTFNEEEKKNSQKSHLLEYEEVPHRADKLVERRKGLLVRKVDFPKEPQGDSKKPAFVVGSTSTWKKWLQPKPKLHQTRSTPN